jgi:hypothetical protein
VAKAAISVEALLPHDHLIIRQEGHRDFAFRRLARNERGDTAINVASPIASPIFG